MKSSYHPRIRRGRSRRGSAFFFTLVVLMVMSIVGMALASTSTQALRLTRIQENGSIAFNLAESGAERAVLWLRQQASAPGATAPFDPFGGPVALGNGTYQVTMDGDDMNALLELKRFTIVSVGKALGRQETVEMYVQSSTFGRYAYFTDYERSPFSTGAIWFKKGEVVDGPAHSNNQDNTDFHINYVGSTASIFKEQLTGAGDEIIWNPTSGPTTEAEFRTVFEEGSRGYQLSVNNIPLPATTDLQKRKAWGADTGFPTSSGVYIGANGSTPRGGIYLNGDSTVEFVDGSTTTQNIQVIQVVTNSTAKRTKITVNRTTGQTIVRSGDTDWTDSNGGGTVTTYTGLPNGVLYSSGNITSLKGTLSDSRMDGDELVSRNAWTIATDIANRKEAEITGDLRYKTSPDKTKPWDDPLNLKSAAMGLVAYNIKLSSTAPANLTIHGVMLAGSSLPESGTLPQEGSFTNESYSDTSKIGTLTLNGGIIQKRRGPVGQFNGTTGLQTAGFAKNYSYDRRMAINPPPFFPTTGGYDRLSWTRPSAGGVVGGY